MNPLLNQIDEKIFALQEGLHDDLIIEQVTLLPGEDGETKERRSIRAEICFLNRQKLNLLGSVVTLDAGEEIVSFIEMNIADVRKEYSKNAQNLAKILCAVQLKRLRLVKEGGSFRPESLSQEHKISRIKKINKEIFDLQEGLYEDSIIDQVTLRANDDGERPEKRSARAEIAFLRHQKLNLLEGVVTLDTAKEIVSFVEVSMADAAKEHDETMSYLDMILRDVKSRIRVLTIVEARKSEAHV